MERRVIKFNLVGSIFVLLLIIGAIVGIVIGVNYAKKAKDGGNKSAGENQEQIRQNNQEQEAIDEETEYPETVVIGDEEKEITMKICKGSMGYMMKYDANDFYIDKDIEGKDIFHSLTSDTIYINVFKESEVFEDRVNDLILDSGRREGFKDYEIVQTEINGKNTYKETMITKSENIINYYIEANDGLFVVEVHVGNKFADGVMPVIEKMVGSFQIFE